MIHDAFDRCEVVSTHGYRTWVLRRLMTGSGLEFMELWKTAVALAQQKDPSFRDDNKQVIVLKHKLLGEQIVIGHWDGRVSIGFDYQELDKKHEEENS
jgi:hypothetical protein